MFSEGNSDNLKPKIETGMMRLKGRGKIAFKRDEILIVQKRRDHRNFEENRNCRYV